MVKSNGGIIGPDNVTTGGFSGVASGVFKLGEVTDLIRESKWPEVSPFINTIPNSVRLDGGGTYFSRTQTAGNRRTWTQSGWYKFDGIDPGNAQSLVSTNGTNTGTNFHYTLEKGGSSGGASDTLSCHGYGGDIFQTTRLLRDYSGWYHIVLAVDTTQGTSANRMKLYVNGESVTMSEQAQYPAQNFEFGVNNNGIVIGLGTHPGSVSGYQFTGYMANIELVDGLAYGPEYFGSTNADSGIWTPIPTSTISSYGTNGFKLAFANASALGTDTSGQSNNFTANSITSIDQSTDSPSNNFSTLNELATSSYNDLTDGSLTVTGNTSTNDGETFSSIIMPNATGKWYWEIKCINKYSDGNPKLGFTQASRGFRLQNGGAGYGGATNPAYDIMIRPDGKAIINGSTSGSAIIGTWGTGDTLSFALDSVNGAFYVGINGTWQTSGNPTSGSSRTGAVKTWSPTQGGSTGALDGQAVCIGSFNGSVSSINFGNPPYALSSAVADANGLGQFEYAPPTDYFSLCTNNLNVI